MNTSRPLFTPFSDERDRFFSQAYGGRGVLISVCTETKGECHEFSKTLSDFFPLLDQVILLRVQEQLSIVKAESAPMDLQSLRKKENEGPWDFALINGCVLSDSHRYLQVLSAYPSFWGIKEVFILLSPLQGSMTSREQFLELSSEIQASFLGSRYQPIVFNSQVAIALEAKSSPDHPALYQDLSQSQIIEIETALGKDSETALAKPIWLSSPNHLVNAAEIEDKILLYKYFIYLDKFLQWDRTPSKATIFTVVERPSCTLLEYYMRLEQYLDIHPTEGIFVLLLLFRFKDRADEYSLDAFNMHRLLLTCCGVTAKCLDENPFNNSAVARTGGVPLKEYNICELELLGKINFDFFSIFTMENYLKLKESLKEIFAPKEERALLQQPREKRPLVLEDDDEAKEQNKKVKYELSQNASGFFARKAGSYSGSVTVLTEPVNLVFGV